MNYLVFANCITFNRQNKYQLSLSNFSLSSYYSWIIHHHSFIW